MTTKEQGFRHFYKSDLLHSLKDTERERKNIIIQILLSVALPLIIVPILAVVYIETNEELVLIPVIVLLIGAPIYINRLFGETQFYKNFKRKIIGKIIKYVNPTLDYDNMMKIDDAEYDSSKFFNNRETIIYGDDHVSGEINHVKVEFSELLVEFKSDKDKKSHNSKHQFRGMFFMGQFKEKFQGELLVKTTGVHIDEATHSGIEDLEFNKIFKTRVFSNPNEVSKVLTPNVIKSLLTLQAKIHNEFIISFIENKMYFGVSHDEDLFEPTLFHSMLNFDKIKGYFDDLNFPLQFIEEITLEHQ
jgi:hypothetical protein